jgi:hypothetical protein
LQRAHIVVQLDTDPLNLYATYVDRTPLAHYITAFAERPKGNDADVKEFVDFFDAQKLKPRSKKRQKFDTNSAQAANPDESYLEVNLTNLKQAQAVSIALISALSQMKKLILHLAWAQARQRSEQCHGEQERRPGMVVSHECPMSDVDIVFQGC